MVKLLNSRAYLTNHSTWVGPVACHGASSSRAIDGRLHRSELYNLHCFTSSLLRISLSHHFQPHPCFLLSIHQILLAKLPFSSSSWFFVHLTCSLLGKLLRHYLAASTRYRFRPTLQCLIPIPTSTMSCWLWLVAATCPLKMRDLAPKAASDLGHKVYAPQTAPP